MSSKSVEVNELKISVSAVRRLSDRQRYTYYLLGHVFNELMCLQKLIAYSLPKHEDRRTFRFNPELAQAFLLFRLSSAKIWEAGQVIRSAAVSHVLRTDVLPKLEGGADRLKDLNRAISSARWLPGIRNSTAFHYPTLEQWQEFVNPDETWVDDAIYLNEQSGNTFYDASEAIARHWMFSQMEEVNEKTTINGLIDEMIGLLNLTNNFLEEVLGVFILHELVEKQVPLPVGRVSAPDFASVSLPFWTRMNGFRK